MRSEWQTHKGQQFFLCNYANLENNELQTEVDDCDRLIMQEPAGSVLVLVDVNGVPPTRRNIGTFIGSVPHTQKNIRKTAVIGVGFSGQRKVLFDAIVRITRAVNMMVFDDAEKAKDWLVGG